MSISNGYCDLTELKASQASIAAHGTAVDSVLEVCVETASRMVDTYCERRFWTAGTALETRTYAASNCTYLNVDDIAGTAITVASSSNYDGTYDITWAASDFQAEPLNRLSGGLPSPVTRLRAVGDYVFPTSPRGVAGVQVTAEFGFGTAVPTQVQHATILLALRQFSRYDSPNGVLSGDMGSVYVARKMDPDVAAILAPFRRTVVAVA